MLLSHTSNGSRRLGSLHEEFALPDLQTEPWRISGATDGATECFRSFSQGMLGDLECLGLHAPPAVGQQTHSYLRTLATLPSLPNLLSQPSLCSLSLSFFFLGLHPRHTVIKLGVKLELQLPATATATPDLRHVLILHHSSQKHRILNPLSKARNGTCILMDASQICFH